MKIIVHSPAYMASRCADIAAHAWNDGSLRDTDLIGIVDGRHKFSVKRNKSSVTIWYELAPPSGGCREQVSSL